MGKKNKGRKPTPVAVKPNKMTAASINVSCEANQEPVVDTSIPRSTETAEKDMAIEQKIETEEVETAPQLEQESSTASMTQEDETVADKRVTFTEPTTQDDKQESTGTSNEGATTADQQGQDEQGERKTGNVTKRMSSGISNIINRLETSSKLRDSPTLARKRSMVQWERVRMNEFLTLWELVSDPRFAPRRKSLEGMLAAHVDAVGTEGSKERVSASEFLNTVLKGQSDETKSRLLEEIDRCRTRLEADPAEADKNREAVKMPRELIEDLAQQGPLSLDMTLAADEVTSANESTASEFSFDTTEAESAQHIAEITNLMSVLAASYVRLEHEERSMASANNQPTHAIVPNVNDIVPVSVSEINPGDLATLVESSSLPLDNKEVTPTATADIPLPTLSRADPKSVNTDTIPITTVSHTEDTATAPRGAAVAAEAEVYPASSNETIPETKQATPQIASEISAADVNHVSLDSSPTTPIPVAGDTSVTPPSTAYTAEPPRMPVSVGVPAASETTPPVNDTKGFYIPPPVQHTAERSWLSEIIYKFIVAAVLLVGGTISIPIVLFTWPVLLPILLILRYSGVSSRFRQVAYAVKNRVYPSDASSEKSSVRVCGTKGPSATS